MEVGKEKKLSRIEDGLRDAASVLFLPGVTEPESILLSVVFVCGPMSNPPDIINHMVELFGTQECITPKFV